MSKYGKASLEFVELLKEKKFRVTPIRVAILESFAKANQPVSIEELYSTLGKTRVLKTRVLKGLDLTTVYRNVKSFLEAEIVASIDFGTGRILYELTRKQSHHHHVICEDCKKIEYLEVCGIEPHLKLLEKMGYSRLRHNLQFSGICRACS